MPLLEPLPEEKNLSQKVFERVREAILAGELAPGSRLVERRLAEDLEVSHIPVREALARLVDEGLVERNARRGSWVAELTLTDLDEISTLRVVLEQFVVVRAQKRWNEASERRLRTLVTSMQKAAASGDVDRVRQQDTAFHETLWELADHRMLLDLAARLRSRINSFLWAATRTLSRDELELHAQSHGELVDAIASGVPRRARRAMEEHIMTGAKRVRASLERDST